MHREKKMKKISYWSEPFRKLQFASQILWPKHLMLLPLIDFKVLLSDEKSNV